MSDLLESPQLGGIDPGQARSLYLQYRKAIRDNRPAPGDEVAAAAFRHLAEGRRVLDLNKVMEWADTDEESGLPKFAIARADAEFVSFSWRARTNAAGVVRSLRPRFSTLVDAWNRPVFDLRVRGAHDRVFAFSEDTFTDRFGLADERTVWRAMLPSIPPNLRPAGQLHRYHVLWEADWFGAPDDPFLLRRIGSSMLFAVLAHWDLTDVERAVLEGLRGGVS